MKEEYKAFQISLVISHIKILTGKTISKRKAKEVIKLLQEEKKNGN